MSDILSLCPPTYTPWALRPHSSYYSPLHLVLSPSSYGVTKRTRPRVKIVIKHLKVVIKIWRSSWNICWCHLEKVSNVEGTAICLHHHPRLQPFVLFNDDLHVSLPENLSIASSPPRLPLQRPEVFVWGTRWLLLPAIFPAEHLLYNIKESVSWDISGFLLTWI
jgi:hypothetical protein